MIEMLIATCLFTAALLLDTNTKDISRPPNDGALRLSGLAGGFGAVATCIYGTFAIEYWYILAAIPSIFIAPHLLVMLFGKGLQTIWSILFNIFGIALALVSI